MLNMQPKIQYKNIIIIVNFTKITVDNTKVIFKSNVTISNRFLANLALTDCQTVFCIINVVGRTIHEFDPTPYRPPNKLFFIFFVDSLSSVLVPLHF